MTTTKPKKLRSKAPRQKDAVGWREWLALPEIGVERIKAKIDTGARTSALHAWNIRPYMEDGQEWVTFEVHPVQRNNKVRLQCRAPVVDHRDVKSSSGHSETRYVIMTTIDLGVSQHAIELTLTNRDEMGFRLILGRTALRNYYIVDPARSYLTGK